MTTIKRCTLRSRLLRALLIPLAIGFLAIAVMTFFLAINEARKLDDAQLISHARVIRALMDHELREDEPDELDLLIDPEPAGYVYERNFAYRVWLKDELILRSPNSEIFPAALKLPGFANQRVGDEVWRFYTEIDPKFAVQIEVAEPATLRVQQGLRLLGGILGPQLFLIPVLFLAVSLGIRIGLGPIQKLSRQVAARTAQDLSPIVNDVIPRELDPLVTSFNGLLGQVERTLKSERSFTDNAAHELRTPLAAIKTQAQVAAMANDPDERAALLSGLAEGVDRATHVVDQMLGLARLDEADARTDTIDLSTIVEEVTANLQSSAKRAGLKLESHITPKLKHRGHSDAAYAVVRNLLENAIKYTPRSGKVSVTLRTTDTGLRLEVSDTGPGIPDGQKQRVFDRFVRLGGSHLPGAGLGLTIVHRAVDILGGRITLSDAVPTGLVVTVDLPVQSGEISEQRSAA